MYAHSKSSQRETHKRSGKLKTKILRLTDKSLNKVFYNLHNDDTANSDRRSKMKSLLNNAIANELTDRQRVCIIEHYLNGRKEKDIANELGLSPSTVCRHISTAEKKLMHIANYFIN